MNGAILLAIVLAAFVGGYFVYGAFIEKLLGVDFKRKTPAHELRDNVDYVPAHPLVLFGHHFAAIAGAGPIVGPIFAAEFGWGAVILWVVFGCIFMGAVHDMIALFLSVRSRGLSIGTVIGDLIGAPARILFLIFSWCVLTLVVAEFSRQIALTFVRDPAIATASMLFIVEAILFGFLINRFKVSLLVASLIFVPLVFVSVGFGVLYPLDLVKMGLSAATAKNVWIVVLLIYCYFASVWPVWVLLQPRAYLSSYLLYIMAALGLIGIFVAQPTMTMSAFTGLTIDHGNGYVERLFPLLFVLVSCGACSGTHAVIASGTTSKQLASERHIRPVAYGGMLVEGVLATIAIIAVASAYTSSGDYFADLLSKSPAQLFSTPVANFCTKLGIPARLTEGFVLLAISAFLMTTVDACTRLARFTHQELAVKAPTIVKNKSLATIVVCGMAIVLLFCSSNAHESLWAILMSANQLIAALMFLAASVYLARNKKPCFMTLIPMLFMLAMSVWSLWELFLSSFNDCNVVRAIATAFLLILAVFLVGLSAFKAKK